MRFESQTTPQDDHTDRITEYSTQYGQAPAVYMHSRETGQGKMGSLDVVNSTVNVCYRY